MSFRWPSDRSRSIRPAATSGGLDDQGSELAGLQPEVFTHFGQGLAGAYATQHVVHSNTQTINRRLPRVPVRVDDNVDHLKRRQMNEADEAVFVLNAFEEL